MWKMAQCLGQLKNSQKFDSCNAIITRKLLYNESRVCLCKKGYAKNGPHVRKIRRFAKVANMAIFRYIAKGIIRQKCKKNGPIFGANWKFSKVDKFDPCNTIITIKWLYNHS